MILEQYYLGCLAQASYLIGDAEARVAAVVDPRRDVGEYLADAERFGVEIRHVILTHFHADFLAGHLELRDRCGATIHLGARAEAEYAFTPLADGDTLDLGKVRLKILETPGHTPEGISILVFDTAQDAENPHAVLTGDTLFIGDVGRPDLMASVGVTAEELAGMLHDSLHEKLLPLPDATLLYPGHGAGSMCGRSLGKETVSTIGEQRRFNYALQPMSREDFIGIVAADQPDAPLYFSYDAMLNKKERQTLETAMNRALKGLTVEEVLRRRDDDGAQVIDVRDPLEFAGGHLIGSTNIGLGGKYATWAGTLLDRHQPIIVVGEPGQEEEAVMRLGRIGFDHVVGYLEGGIAALDGYPDLIAASRRITVQNLADMLEDDDLPAILDVRTESEWKGKRIRGSINVPLSGIREHLDQVPRDRQVAIHCATGYRSSVAQSLLRQEGFDQLMDVVGGIVAWETSGLPCEVARAAE